jgi:histidyl-tRNA synthetase
MMKEKNKKSNKGGNEKSMLRSKEKSAETALYYGFHLIDAPSIKKEDIHKTKEFLDIDINKREIYPNTKQTLIIKPEEKVALLRLYDEANMQAWIPPVMLYYEGSLSQEGSKKQKKSHEKTFHLDILGTHKSIAEATLIKTAAEVLREEGYEDLSVHINSIGDRESVARFCKELANYYRKNIELLSPHCKQVFKKDPYEVFECKGEKCQAIKEGAPNPICFLGEDSRQHFKEVLEYLEELHIPYHINNTLVCSKKVWSQTAFEIRETKSNELLAVGMRYNSIAKKLGFKKDLGAIGLTVSYCKKNDFKKSGTKTAPKLMKSPKVYLIQLGFEAKRKSLEVVEMLRQAKIPLAQSLSKDKLGGQIQSAENSKIPYTIIMGQKEAMENSVIVRDMSTRSQEIVALNVLPQYLKKIK